MPEAAEKAIEVTVEAAPDGQDSAMKAMMDGILRRNPTVTASLESILYPDSSRISVIRVPSGRLNEKGEEMEVVVKVRDIGDKGLLAAYEDARRKADSVPKEAADRSAKVDAIEREAHAMLWERCVVEPAALATRDGIAKSWPLLPTRFREALSVRILRANGVQGFLEAVSLL
jgi:hypothetical protein